MKYLALLRGINVGGKAALKMAELKTAFERAGFTNVSTYINSGNVLFESSENSATKLTHEIQELLAKHFFPIKVVVVSKEDLDQVVKQIPKTWHKEDLRKYIAFIKPPTTPEDIIEQTDLKEGIDFIDKGQGVVYMSTKMEGITKTHFTKLATKKFYQDMTIRNFTTVEKLLILMK